MKFLRSKLLLLLTCFSITCAAQEPPETKGGIPNLPSRFLDRIQQKTDNLNIQLARQTEKFIQRMQRRERRIYNRLYKVDSSSAKRLFAGSDRQYSALQQKVANDTGGSSVHLSGEYQAYTDSLQGLLKFSKSPKAVTELSQLQRLEAKINDADQIKDYVRQRKQLIMQYAAQHADIAYLLGKNYQAMNQELYYYSQRVREYKATLNDPDKLEKEALALLSKLPAWQAFMRQNSQLAGLFNLPANYGSPQTLAGMQTRDQVAALIQRQVSIAGSGGSAALQSNLRSAQTQLQGYKDKLQQLGGGGGNIDMPDFKPNQEKTKNFWRRLECGTNFQTSRNSYAFPTVSDLGLSIGYKLNDRSTMGIGGSYKLGWGNGIQHIAFSSEGAGLRSFLDIKIKGTWSATGGLEYNYAKPFNSFQRLYEWNEWTRSGLIGLTKTVSMKGRVFKKTNIQLLWDFLSYQQTPKTQAVLFRVGYVWR